VNSEIKDENVAEVFDLAKKFLDQPLEDKRAYALGKYARYVGYHDYVGQKVDPARETPDDREVWSFATFCNDEPPAENLPPVFDGHLTELAKFARQCSDICGKILEAFAIALEIPESEGGKDWFKSKHPYDAADNASALIFNKYPCRELPLAEDGIRLGSHGDWGSVTLLFQDEIPGLEIQLFHNTWSKVPVIPGGILVNVGEMIQDWSDGLFKATKHRVIFEPEQSVKNRYSLVYFCNLADDTPLSPVPSPMLQEIRDKKGATESRIMTAKEHFFASMKRVTGY